MRAIVCSPASPHRIELRDVAEPVPARDEAVIAQAAFSLNRGEQRRLGWESDGWRPGYDVAGVVIAGAPDGTGPAAGSRVAGVLPNGSWAERVAVPARRLAEVPEDVGLEVAASLPVGGLTALAALGRGGILPGTRVLVTGAAGGVGRFTIALAKIAGATVRASVGSPERAASLVGSGADAVEVGLDRAGPLADLVVESIGGATLQAAVARLAPGGTLVAIGASSDEPATFDALGFVRKGGVTLYGMSLFDELERQGIGGRELSRLLDLVVEGRLTPAIDVRGSWHDLGPMLDALRDRRIAGKAVVRVD